MALVLSNLSTSSLERPHSERWEQQGDELQLWVKLRQFSYEWALTALQVCGILAIM